MAVIYLSLGSNTGDRVAFIQQAVKLLEAGGHVKVVRYSTLYETEPWGYKKQGWFLNAVVEAKTDFSPVELLNHTQDVEQTLGRVREGIPRWGERTIDIDILFYNNEIINLPELTIPHKLMHKRAFVLVPLMEIIPLFKHPIFDKTILELHDEISQPEDVFLYGTIGV